jgi:hypothetical protein
MIYYQKYNYYSFKVEEECNVYDRNIPYTISGRASLTLVLTHLLRLTFLNFINFR